MSARDRILEYVRDGRWHTTVEIADALGIDTNTVWAKLNSEEGWGYVENGGTVSSAERGGRTTKWRWLG